MVKPAKSIDGILRAPAQRPNIYITKPKIKDLPKQTISFQPRPDIAPPQRRTAPAVRKRDFVQNDMVVRLPRHRVVYARVLSVIQYIVFAALALIAAGNSTFGQYFVLAYAVYVLVLRKSSQRTFLLALLLLVSIPLFQILKQTGIADNMAIYTYELLVIGTIQAVIELKWPTSEHNRV